MSKADKDKEAQLEDEEEPEIDGNFMYMLEGLNAEYIDEAGITKSSNSAIT